MLRESHDVVMQEVSRIPTTSLSRIATSKLLLTRLYSSIKHLRCLQLAAYTFAAYNYQASIKAKLLSRLY